MKFEIKKNNYNLNNISFKFKNLDLNSDQIKVIQKKSLYFTEGNLKNKKNTINKNLIYLNLRWF